MVHDHNPSTMTITDGLLYMNMFGYPTSTVIIQNHLFGYQLTYDLLVGSENWSRSG